MAGEAEQLDFDEATRLVVELLKCSTGRAKKLVCDAYASGEVDAKLWGNDRFEKANIRPGVLWRYGEKPSIDFYLLNRIDLLDWLKREHGASAEQLPIPHAQRQRTPVEEAAHALWGPGGPPKHLSNKEVCAELAPHLKRQVSDTTILRAVGRKT
jgi:hypothetical protein